MLLKPAVYFRFSYFVRISVLAGIISFVPGRSVAVEQPLLRFVQWNDVHACSPNASSYTLANKKLECLVKMANEGATPFPKPDFVIGLGDMVHRNQAEDFGFLKTKLALLKCPYYPVIGNHEGTGYSAAFGAERVNYTFQAAGIQFIILDTSSGVKDVARNQWIQKVFEASPGVPKILCCHVPLATMREERVLPRSFGCVDYFHTIDPTLQKIVADPENNVVAVLSGHLHLTGVVKENDIHHIVTSGTASYPCDFAYYEVFHDRIHVQMVTLPEVLVTPDTDIHGPPRWPTAYTDSNHLTHYSYVAGNPSERSFDIPISLPDLSAPSCSAVGPPE